MQTEVVEHLRLEAAERLEQGGEQRGDVGLQQLPCAPTNLHDRRQAAIAAATRPILSYTKCSSKIIFFSNTKKIYFC